MRWCLGLPPSCLCWNVSPSGKADEKASIADVCLYIFRLFISWLWTGHVKSMLSYSDFQTFSNNVQAPRHLSRCVCLHLTPFCYHIICLLIMGRACQTNLGYLDFRTFLNNAQAPRHLSRCVCLHLTSLLPLHHLVLVIFVPLSSWSWMVTGGICSSYLPNLFLLHLFCVQRKTAFGAKQEGPTLDGSVHHLLVYPTMGAHGSYRKCADLKLCSPEEQEQAAQCSRVYWARYRQKYMVWLCAIWSCWH
jgi:hypothetical protein